MSRCTSSTCAADGSADSAAGRRQGRRRSDRPGGRTLLLQLYGENGEQAIPRERSSPSSARRPRRGGPGGHARRPARRTGRYPDSRPRRQAGPTGDRRPQRGAGAAPAQDEARRDLTTAAGRSMRSSMRWPAEAPPRIEAYDVSNLQGADVVALVVFEDGLPRKAEYRRFRSQGSRRVGFDDVAAIRGGAQPTTPAGLRDNRGGDEVDPAPRPETGRPRCSPMRRAWWSWTAASRKSTPPDWRWTRPGRGHPGHRLAKWLEEVVATAPTTSVILPRTSEGLYLLQRIRDEAHRFAITYHRQRCSRSMVDSLLDGVPGLGPSRRRRCWPASGRSSSCGQPPTRSARCRGSGAEPQMPWSRPSCGGGLPSRDHGDR